MCVTSLCTRGALHTAARRRSTAAFGGISEGGQVVLQAIQKLIELFAPHCRDVTSLNALREMIADRGTWPGAHRLFGRIREKTLRAERAGDRTAEYQYLFEEVCAQTLYNLSGEPAPFDADAPFWIIPNALALARQLGIEASRVVAVVTPGVEK
jgi:hypothetical protein